jgi:hypothetical protein
MNDYRATPEQWNDCEQWAINGGAWDACIIELRARVETLEASLLTTRSPNPLSLKEQALEQLDGIAAVFRMSHGGDIVCDKIRRALEALPND